MVSSGRAAVAMTEAETLDFLGSQRKLQVATLGRDGAPHLTTLFFVVDDLGRLAFWTYASSQKVRNLERDPRATLQVETGTEYQELRGVMFETDVVIHRDVDDVLAVGMEVFQRYTPGLDGELADEVVAMVRKQAEKRVAFQFVERRRASWDHRKLGGVY